MQHLSITDGDGAINSDWVFLSAGWSSAMSAVINSLENFHSQEKGPHVNNSTHFTIKMLTDTYLTYFSATLLVLKEKFETRMTILSSFTHAHVVMCDLYDFAM